MGRYPAESLEDKLVWMRARQERKRESSAAVEEARRGPVVALLPRASPSLPQMLRVKEVARALGVSETTVRVWFGPHSIIVKSPHNKRKTVMLIPQRVLDDWLREHGPSSR